MFDDPFLDIRELDDLRKRRFTTPGGRAGKPFKVLKVDDDALTLRTSAGGKVSLRSEVFQVAEQLLRDLGALDDERWVAMSDPTLDGVLRGQNRDKACTSYVFPLLEAIERVEIDRGRPVRFRLAGAALTEDEGEPSPEDGASGEPAAKGES